MDLKTLEEKLDSLGEKLDKFGGRLEEGDRLFRRIEYDLTTCLRGVQVLLLEKATKLQVVKSLSEVTEALERLEREHNERVTLAPEEDTKPNHVVPVRDTQPSPPLDGEHSEA